MFKVKVYVTLKEAVLDPQGHAVQNSLHTLGFTEVHRVRVGKFLDLHVDGLSEENVAERVSNMCDKLLANCVIEDYRFEIMEG